MHRGSWLLVARRASCKAAAKPAWLLGTVKAADFVHELLPKTAPA